MTDMPEPGQMEEDWLYMQQLYPNTARKLVYYIEDAADRLEYENSMMFDNYPDRIAVERVVKEIIAVIQENDPALITMPEDTAVSERKGDQTWDSCMEEMIQIMLLGEMHHRRWRYQMCIRDRGKSAGEIADYVISEAKDGDIILLHDIFRCV